MPDKPCPEKTSEALIDEEGFMIFGYRIRVSGGYLYNIYRHPIQRYQRDADSCVEVVSSIYIPDLK